MIIHPARHSVWTTDAVDLSNPFQRRWYIRQVLMYGRSEDIRTMDLREVAEMLDDLNLPPDLHRLWKTFRETWANAQG